MTPAMLLRNLRVIAFRPVFVEITGSIKAALLLSQALYCQQKVGPGVKWHKTYENWKIETGLSRHELDAARELCKGLLPSERKGMPPKTYYWLDLELLASKLSETGFAAGTIFVPSSCPESDAPRYESRSFTSTCTKEEQEHTKKTIADDPTKPGNRDNAIALVRLFDETFKTYKKQRTAKELKKELEAAQGLLASLEASDVIALARCCARDPFAPSRGRASNLQKMLANLETLRSVYVLRAPSVHEQKPTGDIRFSYPGDPLKTYRETITEWNHWLELCKESGQDPFQNGLQPPIPPEDGNWDVPMKRENEL